MAKSKHKPALIDMMGLLLTTRSYALAINVGLGLAHLVEMQDAPYILAGLVETIIVLIATNAYLPVSEEMAFWRAMTVLNPFTGTKQTNSDVSSDIKQRRVMNIAQ